MIITGTALRCRQPDKPVDDSPDSSWDYVQRVQTCISAESIDAAISPVWSFVVQNVADVGEAKLTQLVGLLNKAYTWGKARLSDFDRLLKNIADGGRAGVEIAYNEGVRLVRKAIVVGEPAPSHVKAVMADLQALKASPNPTNLTVVPKDAIVAPTPTPTPTPTPSPSPPGQVTCVTEVGTYITSKYCYYLASNGSDRILHGLWERFAVRDNNQLAVSVTWVNGAQSGPAKEYASNDIYNRNSLYELYREGEYVNGEKTGIWTQYRHSESQQSAGLKGKIQMQTKYGSAGAIIEEKTYCSFHSSVQPGNRGQLHTVGSNDSATGQWQVKYVIPRC